MALAAMGMATGFPELLLFRLFLGFGEAFRFKKMTLELIAFLFSNNSNLVIDEAIRHLTQ